MPTTKFRNLTIFTYFGVTVGISFRAFVWFRSRQNWISRPNSLHKILIGYLLSTIFFANLLITGELGDLFMSMLGYLHDLRSPKITLKWARLVSPGLVTKNPVLIIFSIVS